MEFIFGTILLIFSFLFAYVSSVVVQEEKTGKPQRLFWEKKWD